MIMTTDSGAAKKISSTSKYNNGQNNPSTTNHNLYSMIYQNRSKNLVSNYLKGIDSQVRGQLPQKVTGSSRNQALVAPQGTKKMTRNTMGGLEGSVEGNKSLVGRYY